MQVNLKHLLPNFRVILIYYSGHHACICNLQNSFSASHWCGRNAEHYPRVWKITFNQKKSLLNNFLLFYDPSKAKAHLLKSYFGTTLVSSLPGEDFRFSDLGFEVSFSSALISLKSDLTWELELILGKHFLFTFALQSRRSVSLKKSEDFFLMNEQNYVKYEEHVSLSELTTL